MDNHRPTEPANPHRINDHELRQLPLIVEALALRSCITAALNLDLIRIKMFSDNSTLIRAINNGVQIKEIFGVVKDIQEIASSCVDISFSYCPRNQNVEADTLAKDALKSSFVSGPLAG